MQGRSIFRHASVVRHSVSRFARVRLSLLATLLAPGFALAQEDLYVYATNLVSDNVSVYSTNADGTLSAVATVSSVGSGPAGVAIRGDQAFMYVVGTNGDSLHVVDTRTNTVVQNIASGLNGPWGLAVSPDGKRLYVSNHDANTMSVFTIDTLSGQLTAASPITVGTQPRAVVFSPDGTKAYVINQGSSNNGSVSVIDVATGVVTATIATTKQLMDGAITPGGARLYVSYAASGVHVIDTTTNTLVGTGITVDDEPRGLDMNADGTKLYITRVNAHAVSVMDLATETLTSATATGLNPQDFTLSPAGGFGYAAVATANTIEQFTVSATTGALTANGNVTAGTYPFSIAICKRGDSLLANGNTFVAHTGAALGCTGSSAEFTGGTLLVNGANQTFATPISVGTGGGTIDTNGYDATISSVLSGSAALTITGGGTLTLTGTNTHTGTLDIDEGMLKVNGTLNSATVNVATGATLSGSGVINGNVYLDNGATLDGVTVNGTLSGPGAPVVIPVHTVSQLMKDVNLQGIITLTAGGIVDGGYLDGTVTSNGLIKGVVRLGPNTTITGGTVSGSITGQASSPARIMANIAAGTVLQNVRILRGSRVDPGIRIGRNVVIEDIPSIPAGVDLTYAFAPAPDTLQHIPLLDAALDHPAGMLSTVGTVHADMQAALDALQMTGAMLSQNARGELSVRFDGLHSTLLPVQVRLADGMERGIRILEDGSVLFSLGWYAVLAIPAPADSALLASALEGSALNIHPGDRSDTALFARSLNPAAREYFAFRPALYAMPMANSGQGGLSPLPGLARFVFPDMPAPTGLVLIFEDAVSGGLRRQDLLPVPADWQALKTHLATMPGIDTADMDADGVITVTQSGQTIRVRAGYRVVDGAGNDLPVVLQGAGDRNDDGLIDYRVVYPNGDSQLLYRVP